MKSVAPELEVESRATSSWEHGNLIHEGTQKILRQYGVPYASSKTSQQVTAQDFANFDLILAMDNQNLSDLRAVCPPEFQDKIQAFDQQPVPDPWYTGDFEATYRQVLAACQTWRDKILEDKG